MTTDPLGGRSSVYIRTFSRFTPRLSRTPAAMPFIGIAPMGEFYQAGSVIVCHASAQRSISVPIERDPSLRSASPVACREALLQSYLQGTPAREREHGDRNGRTTIHAHRESS